jgi:RNA polymerase sigma-70 factor (ECF subfamily)
MLASCDDTDELVARASQGDEAARHQLLDRHRARLRRMVAMRLDPRLASRLDPSDIVQEALADATVHLDEYLRTRPLPFYLWLRRLTWERVVEAHRRNIKARKRSVARERSLDYPLSDDSMMLLARRFVAPTSSPSHRLVRDEQYLHVLAELHELRPRDREVLVLLYLEQLSTKEAATVLNITDRAVMARHTRALIRLRARLEPEQE